MRTLSKDVKKKKKKKKKNVDVKNKAVKASNQRSNCPHGSSDVPKGRVQMSMATIVTSGMKNPPKKLDFSQVLPRFWL